MFDRRSPGRLILTVALTFATLGSDTLFSQAPQSNSDRRTVLLDGREVVEGEVIVRYRSGTGRVERERAEFEADSDASEVLAGRIRRMRSRRLSTRELIERLRNNPDVELVEPNYIIRANAIPNDPSFNALWGLHNTGQIVDGVAGVPGADISAVNAWDMTQGSRANIVAILDTGVDYFHPDLAANVFTAPRQFSITVGTMTITCAAGTHGYNAIVDSCQPFDDSGHGTHVAGIVGAVGNNGVGVTGVNWIASILPLKVLDTAGTGTTAHAIKAIEWVIKLKAQLGAEANVRVLNASWGGPTFSQALDDQIEAANNADMLFVASAGSNATNIDVTGHYPAASTRANVLSVTAINNRGDLDADSNYGAMSVDLGAPGGSSILSTLPENQYGQLRGTSMAAPFVSGAAALVLSVCPSNTATLKQRLLAAVDPVSSLSGKTVSGGRLNVATAIATCAATLHASISGGTITAIIDNGPGNTNDWVGLYCPASNGDTSWMNWKYLSNSRVAPSSGLTAATVTFPAPTQSGVSCNVRFFASDGWTRLATSNTVTTGPSTPPTLTLSSTSVAPGGTFSVTVSNAPGNQYDWIGLYQASAPDTSFIHWVYLNGSRTAPATGLTNATVQFTAPATAGNYNVRFFSNNSYAKLATSATVTVSGSTTPPTLTIGDVSISEGNSGTSVATFTVTLAPVNASQTVTVNYATADGTATVGGNDYAAASGTLTFPPSTSTRTISVTVNGDSTVEPNETFFVNLSGATNATIGDGQAVGTITSEEVSSGATITVASTTVAPGGVIQFTISGGPGNQKDWVALFDASAPDTSFLDWKYLNGSRTAPTTGVTGATLQFTAPTTPGTYNIRFFANNGFTKLATSVTISVCPCITVASTTVAPGAAINFTISGGPANPKDWVALFATGANDSSYIQWKYLNGSTTAPATGVSSATLQFTAPTTPGTYNIRFFADNGFTRLATSVTITVGPSVTVTSTTVAPGAPINFTVAGGPANPRDWVGLYSASAPDTTIITWVYLSGSKTPPGSGVSGATLQFTAPTTPGTYNIRFFVNDTFTRLATSPTITVSP